MDAIDRTFDGLDRGLTACGKLFGIDRDDRREQARAAVSPAPARKQIARRVVFRIDGPIIDAETGKEFWLVTDGGAARAECATREFAEQLLAALEAK